MALIQPVKNGEMEKKEAIESTEKKRTGTSALGKDAFLQLLVAQMKYQDPLNPTSDTEYVSQLAQFSQLEQLQNLSSTNQNSQLLSMVGKEVCVTKDKDDGSKTYVEGTIEGVTISGGKAYVSVDGALYDSDHIADVYKEGYLLEKKMPTVAQMKFAYDGLTPKNLALEVNFGKEEAKATDVAFLVDGDKVINPEYVRQTDNYYIINQDVFSQLETGPHKISVVFNNDPYYTTKKDVIHVDVINPSIKEDTDVFLKQTEEEKPAEGAQGTNGN